jgi:hypothetical protein
MKLVKRLKTVMKKDIILLKAKKPIQILYNILRRGDSLSKKDIKIFEENDCTLPQLASLGVFLTLKKQNNFEELLLKKIIENSSELSEYLLILNEKNII